MNLSVERKEDTSLTAGDTNRLVGYVRIRSKTQGIALSLGERISTIQRVAASAIQEAAVEVNTVLPTE